MIGGFLLRVTMWVLSAFALFMVELPLVISIPLFVIFPPLFFAFLGGVMSFFLLNALGNARDMRRESVRERERRKWQEHKRALGYDG